MLADMLAEDWIPERVKAPECRGDLAKLALLRARAQLLWEALDGDAEELAAARRAGGNSPIEIWQQAQEQASRLQAKLGLNPLDLLEEQRVAEAEAGPNRMAAIGAEIRARREAELGGFAG
jgi:hypothetical protein